MYVKPRTKIHSYFRIFKKIQDSYLRDKYFNWKLFNDSVYVCTYTKSLLEERFRDESRKCTYLRAIEAVKYFIRRDHCLFSLSLFFHIRRWGTPSFKKWARKGTLNREDLGLLLLGSERIARGETPDYPFVLKAFTSSTTPFLFHKGP